MATAEGVVVAVDGKILTTGRLGSDGSVAPLDRTTLPPGPRGDDALVAWVVADGMRAAVLVANDRLISSYSWCDGVAPTPTTSVYGIDLRDPADVSNSDELVTEPIVGAALVDRALLLGLSDGGSQLLRIVDVTDPVHPVVGEPTALSTPVQRVAPFVAQRLAVVVQQGYLRLLDLDGEHPSLRGAISGPYDPVLGEYPDGRLLLDSPSGRVWADVSDLDAPMVLP